MLVKITKLAINESVLLLCLHREATPSQCGGGAKALGSAAHLCASAFPVVLGGRICMPQTKT